MAFAFRYTTLIVLILGTTLLATPPSANGQKKQVSAEQRITELEQLVQDLQQRIVHLEAKINTPRVKERQIVGNGNWRDKNNWRRLRNGMTMEDVVKLLGEPEKVDSGSFLVFWYWGSSDAKVQFGSESNTVAGWTEP